MSLHIKYFKIFAMKPMRQYERGKKLCLCLFRLSAEQGRRKYITIGILSYSEFYALLLYK